MGWTCGKHLDIQDAARWRRKRRFLAYSFPSRSPNPRHLAVLGRPGLSGPLATLTGTTRIGLPYAGEGGVSLEGMLADAADAGFTVTLRTV